MTLRRGNSIVASVFDTNDLSVFQTLFNAKVPGPRFGPSVTAQRPTVKLGEQGGWEVKIRAG